MLSGLAFWVGAGLLLSAFFVDRCRDAARARRISVWLVGSTTGASVLGVCLVRFGATLSEPSSQLLGPRLGGTAPVVIGLVGWVAVAMAPLASHSPRTFSKMLVVLAIAFGFLATRSPIAWTALWAGSAFTVWTELKRAEPTTGEARRFAGYHFPSVLAFGIGVMLFESGVTWAGAALIGVAILIREAMLPFWGWLPGFVDRAPLGLVVVFVAPQLGVHAHFGLFPAGLPGGLGPWVAVFGAVTAVAASAFGLAQNGARRALAYLMISQTGLVAFGLENASKVAVTGAWITWQVLALATSGFAMSLAALEARRGRQCLSVPGGTFASTPRLAVSFFVLGFATVGFPLTLGFVAEDLLVQGAVDEFPLLALSLIVATALNGMTVMRLFFNLFSGNTRHLGERDLTPRELLAVTFLLATLVGAGLLPSGFV